MTFILESVEFSSNPNRPTTTMPITATISPADKETPFLTSAATTNYYTTPELAQRFNLVRHLIENSEQLLLVLAKMGSGKTSLLNQLRNTAKEHWWIYHLNSGPALSPDSLLSAILGAFNIKRDGKSSQILQENLRNHIVSTRYNGQLPVLMVDDAHLLPLATLKLIVELAMQGEPLTRMKVVLFCEPQITSILATPEFEIIHNTLIHTLDVPSFTESQVREYLFSRIQDSTYHYTHPFNNEEIKKIFLLSEGIPSQVNELAHQLLQKFDEQRRFNLPLLGNRRSRRIKLLWSVLVFSILLGTAFLVYWYYPEWFNQSPPLSNEMALPAQSSVNASPTPSTSANGTGVKPEIISPPSTTPSRSELPSTSMTEDTATLATQSVSGSTVTELNTQPDLKGVDWLRNQNPRFYTLQVLGAYDPMTLKNFIAQHKLPDMAIFKTTYHNKEWFVLVQGSYATQEMAQASLAKLSKNLPTTIQPWTRTFASIQTLLAK